jgi:hypothetical protein
MVGRCIGCGGLTGDHLSEPSTAVPQRGRTVDSSAGSPRPQTRQASPGRRPYGRSCSHQLVGSPVGDRGLQPRSSRRWSGVLGSHVSPRVGLTVLRPASRPQLPNRTASFQLGQMNGFSSKAELVRRDAGR